MVTINPATYFGLDDRGVLSPSKIADIAVINDLEEMDVEDVFIEGRLVAVEGKLLINLPKYIYPSNVKNSVKREKIEIEDLEINSDKKEVIVRCIKVVPDQNLTESLEEKSNVKNKVVGADISKDLLYICCVERYGRNNNIGKAFVKGFGLRKGAFAESVAHDTHNIIAVVTNIRDMVVAINHVIEIG